MASNLDDFDVVEEILKDCIHEYVPLHIAHTLFSHVFFALTSTLDTYFLLTDNLLPRLTDITKSR
jgi:hypothetical protein